MKPVIETLASDLDDEHVTPEAIRKWRTRGWVPHKHRLPLLAIARRRRVRLTEDDFVFAPEGAA